MRIRKYRAYLKEAERFRAIAVFFWFKELIYIIYIKWRAKSTE
jgi:hypothetical protein